MISTFYGFNYTGVSALKNDSLFAWLFSLLILISQCCLISVAHAQSTRVAQVVSTQGPVTAINAQQVERTLQRRSTLNQGDTVITGKSARATIRFSDDSEISLQPQTRYRIDQYHYNKGQASKDVHKTSLLVGSMRAITGALSKRSPKNYAVTTPVAVIGVRGTSFTAKLIPKGNCQGSNCDYTLVVHRLSGIVTVTANGKTVTLDAKTPYAVVDGRNSTPVASSSAPKLGELPATPPMVTTPAITPVAGPQAVIPTTSSAKGMFIGADYMYAQQGSADSIFGATSPAPGTLFKAHEENGHAFNVFAGYDFGGYYLVANWQRDHDDGKSRTLDGTTINTRLTLDVTDNTGLQFSDFDQVGAMLGHTVFMGNYIQVAVEAGPQYLSITHHLYTEGFVVGLPNIADNKSEFEGGGAEADVLLTYHLCDHFSLFGSAGTGAVFGKLKTTTFVSLAPVAALILPPAGDSTSTLQGKETVVPTFDAIFGGAYTYQMITVDAGVRANVAMNAVQLKKTINLESPVELSNFTQASIFAGVAIQLTPALNAVSNLI